MMGGQVTNSAFHFLFNPHTSEENCKLTDEENKLKERRILKPKDGGTCTFTSSLTSKTPSEECRLVSAVGRW